MITVREKILDGPTWTKEKRCHHGTMCSGMTTFEFIYSLIIYVYLFGYNIYIYINISNSKFRLYGTKTIFKNRFKWKRPPMEENPKILNIYYITNHWFDFLSQEKKLWKRMLAWKQFLSYFIFNLFVWG